MLSVLTTHGRADWTGLRRNNWAVLSCLFARPRELISEDNNPDKRAHNYENHYLDNTADILPGINDRLSRSAGTASSCLIFQFSDGLCPANRLFARQSGSRTRICLRLVRSR